VLDDDAVREIQVKQPNATSQWIWGAFKMPGAVFHDLRLLWKKRACRDEYFGTLVNAYLAAGGVARGIRAGDAYVDVGTLHGYRAATAMLEQKAQRDRQPAMPLPAAWLLREPIDPTSAVEARS
jgi:glucose-1-phosphate thymidylyltransferase